ncbi:MAG: polysaccharide deacetylase [Betaproteobacteria bacterium]|jgi:peptidoglycan/xylan/chitin deacetylase (PgdA/CDA1 family)|nr:polysaccharide deacetylase [Betaproteobacteria bacterium]
MQENDYGPFPYTPINRRPALRWPNGARLALWIIPNIEFFSLKRPMASHPWEKAPTETPTVRPWGQRDYGNRVGVFRIMEVLSKYGIRATATVNADICDHHPQILEDALKLDWEFMGHNLTNSVRLSGLSIDEERRVINESLEKLERFSGRRPRGWLGAGLSETWHTLELLADAGVDFVSDWVNDDQPYLMDAGKRKLVYLPYSYELNDSPQLYYRDRSIDDFETMIKRQFDVLYREGEQSARVMAICLHPYLIGVPHRIGGLDAALKYITGHRDVWCATGSEIVDAYLKSGSTF